MASFNPDEMAMRVAQQALDEYVYEGKTLREWVSLIKALDTMPPRLLTLEEAQFATGVGWEEIWFDADEEEGTPEYKECFPCVFINGHYVCEDGDNGEVSPDTYNKPHHSRLWMGWARPGDEAREAAKWGAEDCNICKNVISEAPLIGRGGFERDSGVGDPLSNLVLDRPTLDKWSYWRCGHCGEILLGKPDECPRCGKVVKWMEDMDE